MEKGEVEEELVGDGGELLTVAGRGSVGCDMSRELRLSESSFCTVSFLSILFFFVFLMILL